MEKTQTKALQVTFIHTIYTNKNTSSNFYPYNIHKQKHFKWLLSIQYTQIKAPQVTFI